MNELLITKRLLLIVSFFAEINCSWHLGTLPSRYKPASCQNLVQRGFTLAVKRVKLHPLLLFQNSWRHPSYFSAVMFITWSVSGLCYWNRESVRGVTSNKREHQRTNTKNCRRWETEIFMGIYFMRVWNGPITYMSGWIKKRLSYFNLNP